jgi:hypothetical protein
MRTHNRLAGAEFLASRHQSGLSRARNLVPQVSEGEQARLVGPIHNRKLRDEAVRMEGSAQDSRR